MSNKKQTAVDWLINELKFIKVPEKHNEKLWATIEKAKEITKNCGANYLELRYLNRKIPHPGLPVNKAYVTFLLNLSQGSDMVMEGFNNKVRNAIRKALKSNSEIRYLAIFHSAPLRGAV